MVVVLGAGRALVDLVVGPVAAEFLAVDGQVSDEGAEGGVIGMAARVEAEHGGRVGGDGGPVLVQLAGVGIEEDEACLVAVGRGQGPEVGDQPSGEPVVGEDVEAAAEDEGGSARRFQGVQQSPGGGIDALRARAASAPGGRRTREGVQVLALGVVEA